MAPLVATCCPEYTPFTFDCSCQAENTGKISVKLPFECIPGTIVQIMNSANEVVFVISNPSIEGIFETQCMLLCGESYTVVPIRANCKFTPASQTVIAKCCPDSGQVSFEACLCETPKGKIIVKLPDDCSAYTTLRISKTDNTNPIYLKPDANGVFDSGCVLDCGTTYRIQPFNSTCKFTPEIQYSEAICCSETEITPVTFECTCSGTETKGKIIVKLPSDCLTDTTVRISKSDNTSPIYIKANADGVFDTGCVLVCGTTYRIQPFKTNCKFTPEIQYAKAVCCSETNITPVTFTCSCTNSRGFQIINKVKKPINFNSIFQIRSLWLLKISTQKSMKKYFWLKTLY